MKGGSDRIDLTQRTPTFPPAEINDLISHVIYINLDKRDDRKAHIERELSIFKPEKVTRMPGVVYGHPHVGCAKGHLKALELARDKKYPNVMIVEDDSYWNNIDVTYPILKRLLNEPYDGICLSTMNMGKNIDPTTLRITSGFLTNGYIVKEPFYNKYIELYQNSLKKEPAKFIEEKHNAFIWADGVSQEAYKAGTWYAVSPSILVQLPSHSDINGRFKNLASHTN